MREKKSRENNNKPLPIVAIGASAGGMEAVTELLQHLPPDTGMAYVYIQHLSRSYKSNLAEILGRATEMQVVEAEDRTSIEPNKLIVIPPDKEIQLQDGLIQVVPRPEGFTLTIDRFFSSLAEKQQESSIGVLLSGTNSDGTIGLKAIKAAGGLTIAQDETAQYQGMPLSAITEQVVDLVMSPREIASELHRLS